MAAKLEINKIKINITDDPALMSDTMAARIQGIVPMINLPFTISLVRIGWFQDEVYLPRQLVVTTSVYLEDHHWQMQGGIQWNVLLPEAGEVYTWENLLINTIRGIRLGNQSHILIDDHEWRIIPALNRALKNTVSTFSGQIHTFVSGQLAKLSTRYFGSDLLPYLLHDLQFRFNGLGAEPNTKDIQLTISDDQSHFESPADYPPYVYLRIPTQDLEYLINYHVKPTLEVKGYSLEFQSFQVLSEQHLEIRFLEKTQNWDIQVTLIPEIKNNMIHFRVMQLDASGMNVLTTLLFNIFKGLLKRQIENRTVSIQQLYWKGKTFMEVKLPFIRFMEGWQIQLQKLNFSSNEVEILVAFEKNTGA